MVWGAGSLGFREFLGFRFQKPRNEQSLTSAYASGS